MACWLSVRVARVRRRLREHIGTVCGGRAATPLREAAIGFECQAQLQGRAAHFARDSFLRLQELVDEHRVRPRPDP